MANSSFKIIPLKLFFDKQTKTGSLNILNTGSNTITLQISAVSWSQDETGIDKYDPTTDIIFFPKVITIKTKEEKVLRVGFKGTPDPSKEQTYRLFLQELPVSTEKTDGKTLRMVLNVGIPLFVKPEKNIFKFSIKKAEFSKDKLLVNIENQGNSYFMIDKIKISGLDESKAETFSTEVKGWYVLSGVTKTFPTAIPYEGCQKSKLIRIKAEIGPNSSDYDYEMKVDGSLCPKPLPKEDTKETEK